MIQSEKQGAIFHANRKKICSNTKKNGTMEAPVAKLVYGMRRLALFDARVDGEQGEQKLYIFVLGADGDIGGCGGPPGIFRSGQDLDESTELWAETWMLLTGLECTLEHGARPFLVHQLILDGPVLQCRAVKREKTRFGCGVEEHLGGIPLLHPAPLELVLDGPVRGDTRIARLR
jgi:hypothetical protein